MSALTAVLIIVGAVAVFGPAVWWQFRAAKREEARKDRFIREHCRPPARVPCAPDNEQGINLADHDECELILSLPEYGLTAGAIDEDLTRLFEQSGAPPIADPSWDAGLERLWDAVRDQHTNTPEGD